jgi:hypothetical protein
MVIGDGLWHFLCTGWQSASRVLTVTVDNDRACTSNHGLRDGTTDDDSDDTVILDDRVCSRSAQLRWVGLGWRRLPQPFHHCPTPRAPPPCSGTHTQDVGPHFLKEVLGGAFRGPQRPPIWGPEHHSPSTHPPPHPPPPWSIVGASQVQCGRDHGVVGWRVCVGGPAGHPGRLQLHPAGPCLQLRRLPAGPLSMVHPAHLRQGRWLCVSASFRSLFSLPSMFLF